MSYAIKEIYYTLQGEGVHAGRPSVFCRFAGCNLWSAAKPIGDNFETCRNITEKATRDIEALENDYVLKASPAELERHYEPMVGLTRAINAGSTFCGAQGRGLLLCPFGASAYKAITRGRICISDFVFTRYGLHDGDSCTRPPSGGLCGSLSPA